MKKQIKVFITMIIMLLCLSAIGFADGDTNVDGGGGDVGDGDVGGGSYWNVGDDGVRVSIVEEQNKKVLRTISFSNREMTVDFWFGNVSKLGYSSGKALNLQLGDGYQDATPAVPLPQIISSSGATSIEGVKRYFSDEGNLKGLAQDISFPYDALIGGDYILLLEPVIYVKYVGRTIALTATEAALYDQTEDGKLKAKLGYATHQNLPLAMFLEHPDLGYPAWVGPTTGVRSNSEIISSLGIGTVRFRDAPPAPPPTTGSSYDYRTDTDVITAVTVSSNSELGISPDDNAEVVFNIGGRVIRKPFVTPPYEDTLVWVRWHTPSTPQVVTVNVGTTHGSLDTTSITCDVQELVEKTPPDPKSTDKPPFNYWVPNNPTASGKTSLSWGEWLPWWKENWQWVEDWQWEADKEWVNGSHSSSCSDDCDMSHGSWEDNGKWVDHGEWVDKGNWEYDWESHSASLSVTTKIAPADEVPTAKKLSTGRWEIKSGYGVVVDVQSSVSTSAKHSDVTPVQNGIAQFSEFHYKDYFRRLVCTPNGLRSSLTFDYNKYSFMGASVHYTPIWYPDRSIYSTKVTVFDVWTPAGQLYYSNGDYLNIDGDVYDDWNVSPYIGE